MEVRVEGSPKPSGKWYKDNIEMKTSNEFQIDELNDGIFSLTINGVYPDNTGTVVFKAFNPLGVSTTTTYLSVEGKKFTFRIH